MTLNGTTPNPDFKATPLFNGEYLRKRTKCRHSNTELLIKTYALLKEMISSDLQ